MPILLRIDQRWRFKPHPDNRILEPVLHEIIFKYHKRLRNSLEAYPHKKDAIQIESGDAIS